MAKLAQTATGARVNLCFAGAPGFSCPAGGGGLNTPSNSAPGLDRDSGRWRSKARQKSLRNYFGDC